MNQPKKTALELRNKIMSSVKVSFADAKILTMLMAEEIKKHTSPKLIWDDVINEAKKM